MPEGSPSPHTPQSFSPPRHPLFPPSSSSPTPLLIILGGVGLRLPIPPSSQHSAFPSTPPQPASLRREEGTCPTDYIGARISSLYPGGQRIRTCCCRSCVRLTTRAREGTEYRSLECILRELEHCRSTSCPTPPFLRSPVVLGAFLHPFPALPSAERHVNHWRNVQCQYQETRRKSMLQQRDSGSSRG